MPRPRRRGMSLAEVLIAIFILAIAFASMLGAMMFIMSSAKDSHREVYANDLATSLIEQMRGLPYEDLGTNNTALSASYLGTRTEAILPAGDSVGDPTIDYTVEFRYYGFGNAASPVAASATTVRFDMSNGTETWEANEWVGNLVMVMSGPGTGQIAEITGNSADTLTITTAFGALEGQAPGWLVALTNSSYLEINNGKTVEVIISWNSLFNKPQQLVRRALIIRKAV